MKKLRLKRWVKVVITLLIILVSVKIYTEMGHISTKDVSSIKYQVTMISGWTWLVLGQSACIMTLWED